MFGLGCARGTLLMWQRTYRQNSHLEGSNFESIRPNPSSTQLQLCDYKAYALCPASNHQILVTPSTLSHLTISSHVRSTTADPYLQTSEAEDSAIRVMAASMLYVNRCICIQHRSQVINPNYTLLRSCSVCVNVAVGYCLAYIEKAFQKWRTSFLHGLGLGNGSFPYSDTGFMR